MTHSEGDRQEILAIRAESSFRSSMRVMFNSGVKAIISLGLNCI